MFWIDSFLSMKIKRAWMDGSHMENILSFEKGLPVDLVLDFIKERIYWVSYKYIFKIQNRLFLIFFLIYLRLINIFIVYHRVIMMDRMQN